MRKKLHLEYIVQSPPSILYEFLTSQNGLSRWFCDNVDIDGDNYKFIWDGYDEEATLVDTIEETYVRYHFTDSKEGEYLEFKLKKGNITNDTILTITDFCEDNELKSQKSLWDTKIKELRHSIGG
jgi:uncharacterized protein YndB with AHSA1/START domain